MTGLLELSWRLLRGAGRHGMLGTVLTAAAVTVSTALLLFTIAGNVAFLARADREAWRHPVEATSGAVAIQAVAEDFVEDEVITVVTVAPLPGAERSGVHPPGLSRMPRPGEVWLSPALAELVRELPPERLANRFPGTVAGEIGDEALVHPEELVAVVGRAPDDPAVTREPLYVSPTVIGPTRVADFTGRHGEMLLGYRILTVIASVLMVVPLLVFGGAAARLTVARRDQRLAALRLVGATPGQVVLMTVAEAVIVAAGSAVLGLVLYVASMPLVARIELAGGPWFLSDLWPGLLPVAGVLLAVPLLVGVSAVVGLRRVVISPLGVAKRETPPGMRAIRLVALLAALIAVPIASRNTSWAVVTVVLALAFLALNLAGPWVVSVIGRITARVARGPAALLAGRRLVDDPRSAWRTIAGVALTGFIAGFTGLLTPSGGMLGSPSATDLIVLTPADQVRTVADEARARLARAGIEAQVHAREPRTDGRPRPVGPLRGRVVVELPETADTAQVDTARTALAGLVPGHVPTTPADEQRAAFLLFADLRTGTLIVLSASFLVAIVSAGITASSSVLDRRQTYALLHLAGTPLEVLDRARRIETLVPLAVMGGGSLLAGMFCALPFVFATLSAGGAAILLVTIAVGFGGVIAADALSRPLLRSVTRNPAPRPD